MALPDFLHGADTLRLNHTLELDCYHYQHYVLHTEDPGVQPFTGTESESLSKQGFRGCETKSIWYMCFFVHLSRCRHWRLRHAASDFSSIEFVPSSQLRG